MLFSSLCNHLNLSENNAEKLLDNLSIDLESYQSNIYNPKRNNRLYKKIFFEFDEQIFFIPAMALENLNIIEQSLRFNTPPFSLDPLSQKTLTTISNIVGKSFENITKDILERFDFKVFLNIKEYKKNETLINLNDLCGEIDIIAFNFEKKLCYFLECKMLNFSVEPRHYLEDFNKFFSDNGYYSKFEKKVKYFNNHKDEMINYLLNELKLDFDFEYKFITFYPSISPFLLINDKNNIKSNTLYDLKKSLNSN